MSNSVEKLLTYCEKTYDITAVVLGDGQEEKVLDHLGKTKLIVYTGKNQDKFNELCGTYKAPPVRGVIVYSSYDFGQDVVAIGSMKPPQLYETIESFVPSTVKSSSTRPPQVHFNEDAETLYTGDSQATIDNIEVSRREDTKSWNPNTWGKR